MEDENDEEGFTIEKQFILEAWKRFRPVNKADGDGDVSPLKGAVPRTQTKNIKEIFGK